MAYLGNAKVVMLGGSGGGGGTTNYNQLTNKPSINGVTLQGNKTTSDLNLPTYTAGTGIDITGNVIFNTMRGACAGYISSISTGYANTQITLATNETFKPGELIVLRSDANGTAQTLSVQYGSESSQKYNYNLKDLYGLAKTVTLKENSVLVCMLDVTGYNAIVLAVLAEDFYLEEQVTLSTSQSTTVVFNNSFIRADSIIDVTVSEWGIFPEDVSVTAGATGACTVVLPKVSTAQTVTVGIFVK